MVAIPVLAYGCLVMGILGKVGSWFRKVAFSRIMVRVMLRPYLAISGHQTVSLVFFFGDQWVIIDLIMTDTDC